MLKFKIKKSKIKLKKNLNCYDTLILGSFYSNPDLMNNKEYKLAFTKIKVLIINPEKKEILNDLFKRSLNVFKKKINDINVFFIKLDWKDTIFSNTKINTYLYHKKNKKYLTDFIYINEYIDISYSRLFLFLLF